MSTLETLLVGVITSLAGVIVFLFRAYISEKDGRRGDQLEASKLLFGLMSRLATYRRQKPPVTTSEWEEEPNTAVTKLQYAEASEMARQELNGDIEALVKDFLKTPSERIKAKR